MVEEITEEERDRIDNILNDSIVIDDSDESDLHEMSEMAKELTNDDNVFHFSNQ